MTAVVRTVADAISGGAAYAATVLADSPVGYWRLGESSGTAADNAEGTAARDGTYVNTPTLGATGALTGDADTAIGPLNGTSQCVEIADQAAFDLGDVFSLEAWVSRGATGAAHVIISKSTNAYALALDTNGTIMLSKVSETFLQTTGVLGTGWHHVVGTKNGATAAIYVDGSPASTGAYSAQTCADNALPLLIGADNDNGQFFNGSIDEVAVYATALTSTQVAAHYAAGTGGGGGGGITEAVSRSWGTARTCADTLGSANAFDLDAFDVGAFLAGQASPGGITEAVTRAGGIANVRTASASIATITESVTRGGTHAWVRTASDSIASIFELATRVRTGETAPLNVGRATLAGVDITQLIDAESVFTEQANHLNGIADLVIVDTAGTLVVREMDEFFVYCDAAPIYGGRLRTVHRVQEGAGFRYRCRATTFECLLDLRVIESGVRAGMRTDYDDVAFLLSYVADLGITNFTYCLVLKATGLEDIDYTGMTVRQGLDKLSQIVGATYWIDSAKLPHWTDPRSTQIVVNGTFNTDADSWTRDGSAAWTASTGPAGTGDGALVTTGDGSGMHESTETILNVLPGRRYLFVGDLWSSVAAKCQVRLDWRDSSTSKRVDTVTGTGASTWAHSKAVYTAPTGANRVVVQLGGVNNFTGTVNHDNIALLGETAAWGVSTNPNGSTTFAVEDWTHDTEATTPINRVLIRGNGITGWREHAASISYYGGQKFEGVLPDDRVTLTSGIDSRAAWVFGKYAFPARTGTYRTSHTGLAAGQWQIIEDTVRGTSSIEWIATVRTQFVGAGQLEFEITYGGADEDLATTLAGIGSVLAEGEMVPGFPSGGGMIGSSRIVDGAIIAAKLADNAVTTNKLLAEAVTSAKIAADAVTDVQIAASAVGSDQLAVGSVIAGKIGALAIVAGDIAAGTITGAKIAATTIAAANIAGGTITGNEIAATTITGANIAALAISSDKIAANAIVAGNIAAGAIGADAIAAGAITADKLMVGSSGPIHLTNPGFESGDLTGWTAVAPGTSTVGVSAGGDWNAEGAYVAVIYGGAAGDYPYIRQACGSVSVGEYALVSAMLGNTNGSSTRIDVEWLTSAGGSISFSVHDMPANGVPLVRQSAVFGPAPATAAHMRVYVQNINAASYSVVDDIQISRQGDIINAGGNVLINSSGVTITNGALTVASDSGGTVIIDGTSDMFRICATGTHDFPVTPAESAYASAFSVLTGFDYPPAMLAYVVQDGSTYLTPWIEGYATNQIVYSTFAHDNGETHALIHYQVINSTTGEAPARTARFYLMEQSAI